MSETWSDDGELFALAKRELFTSVVGDVMDTLGLQRQYLPPSIRALDPNAVVIGRAMPVLESDYVVAPDMPSHNPVGAKAFGLMFEALDDLKANEVYICTGASPEYALWGELMSIRARHLGAVGAVVDGYARDTKSIIDMGFPIFAYGSYGQDQAPRGKVIDYRVPIQMNGVRIAPGDIVFGDHDGVCIVPKEAEQEVIRGAFEKVRGEKTVQKAIEGGMSAREAFDTYGLM